MGAIFGTGASRASREAARLEREGQQAGIDELRRQFDLSRGDILDARGEARTDIAPFLEAGREALPGVLEDLQLARGALPGVLEDIGIGRSLLPGVVEDIQTGRGALADVVEGGTAGGLDRRLADIFNTDVFGSLVEERQRAAQGQLAAGGLTRSGTALQEAARIPTELGLQIENQLFGRQAALADFGTQGAANLASSATQRLAGFAGAGMQGLANLAASGQNAATGLGALGNQSAAGLGALGANTSSGIAELFSAQGQSGASGILSAQQGRAAGQANLLNIVGSIGALFFGSDPSLKENVEQISRIDDLDVYQWDWIDGTKGTVIENCATIGFMADEVEEKYPHHVGEFGGFKIINYPSLLSELEHKNAARYETHLIELKRESDARLIELEREHAGGMA